MHFLSTSTSDGIILQGLIRKSKTPTKKLIIHIHGMAGNFFENSFIKQMFEDYPNNNIDFLSVETRGSELMRWFYKTNGKPTLIGNAYELFEDSDKDILAWINLMKKDYKEIYLQGHSLGCSKIAYAITKNKTKVKGIILISPSDMHGLRLHPSEINEHTNNLNLSKKLVKEKRGNELLPKMWDYSRLSANTYLSIFGENTKIFNFYNKADGFKVLNKINVPVLAISGTNDDGIVENHEVAFKLLKKQLNKSPKILTKIYNGAGHSFRGFEKRITDDVLTFLN